MMTLAKPLANGLPIGAVLATDRVAASISPGDHGSTFAGNPLVAAAALAVRAGAVPLPVSPRSHPHTQTLNVLADPDVIDGSVAVSRRMLSRLESAAQSDDSGVLAVRAPISGGLMIGVDVAAPVADVVSRCLEGGVVVLTAGANTVRLVPPLVLSAEQADKAVDVLLHAARDD